MATRFPTFVVTAMLLEAAISLWNTINIFGIGSVLVDNTNTLQGLLAHAACGSAVNSLGSVSNAVNSCANEMIIIVGITSVLTLGSGLVTMMAFGNTYLAFGLILSVSASLVVLQGTVTSILDNFVAQWLATSIGGFFAIVFTVTMVFTIVYVQAKVPI